MKYSIANISELIGRKFTHKIDPKSEYTFGELKSNGYMVIKWSDGTKPGTTEYRHEDVIWWLDTSVWILVPPKLSLYKRIMKLFNIGKAKDDQTNALDDQH